MSSGEIVHVVRIIPIQLLLITMIPFIENRVLIASHHPI